MDADFTYVEQFTIQLPATSKNSAQRCGVGVVVIVCIYNIMRWLCVYVARSWVVELKMAVHV
eukprot:scaffold34642_cov137-Skeletonema_dohrnii-CCMP3373.AAC.1